MSIVRVFFVLTCLAASVACGQNDYGIAIRNLTTREIHDAHVTFEGFRSVGGGIEPGLYVVHMQVGRPIPESAVVEWKTGGIQKRRSVQVRDAVPPRFRGDIFFDIMPDESVQVIPRTEAPPLPTRK